MKEPLLAIIRTARIVLIGSMELFLLLTAAIAMTADEEVSAFFRDGVIAGLIVMLGFLAGDASRNRSRDRRRLLQLQSALKDFEQCSTAMQLNRAQGSGPDEEMRRGINAAKTRVDAAADALLGLPEAALAKEQTSEALLRLQDPE